MSQEVNQMQVFGMISNICLGSLFFGYNMGVYNSLSQGNLSFSSKSFLTYLTYIVMIHLNGWQGGFEETLYPTLITISASVGCIVSAPYGVKALRYTNGNIRIACIYLDFLAVISVLIQIIDCSFFYLLVGRFVAGLVIGLNCSYVSKYITEYSPVSMRGITGCMNQIFICTGLFLSFTLGLLLPTKYDLRSIEYTNQSAWRFNIGITMLFGIVRSFLLSTYFNNDAPSYLHSNGRINDLKNLLQRIYLKQEQVIQIIKDMDKANNQENQEESKHFDTPTTQSSNEILQFDNTNTKSYKRRFILGIVFSISNQLTGINAVMFYSNKIFEDSNQEEIAGICTTALGLILILSTIYGAHLSEVLGRRQMIMKGVSLMTICLFLMGIFASQDSFFLIFFSICIYLFSFSVSQGPLVWAYQAEILDQHGMSISTCVIWIFTLLVGLVFPYLVLELGVGGAFFFFGICSLISLFYFNKELIETKGKSKEQICLEFEGISAEQSLLQSHIRNKKLETPLLNYNKL